MPFAIIPFLLLVIPVMEIAVFIVVGNLIGLWPTLGLVVLTAVIGSFLLKSQGLGTLARIQGEVNAGRVPARELVDGVMIVAAGILLLTPGLVTDTIGFLLFVPGVRSAIRQAISKRVVVMANGGGRGFGGSAARGAGRPSPDVVDLSGDDFHRRPDASSPWHGDDDDGGTPRRTLH
ncbi:membrane protein FxsA [Jiella endophytica]|uniref:Membrane protein FxsA n=1 Tax=Jiella endophytica TaxID=2558362 RepID=A0A4Y8R9E2_9HYPH|nr:FxsA family protein [Jiella endophytica]TFF17794.1 membrane protein FxsA [Jiella endophytica]